MGRSSQVSMMTQLYLLIDGRYGKRVATMSYLLNGEGEDHLKVKFSCSAAYAVLILDAKAVEISVTKSCLFSVC